jgi:hypothetical protein
LTQSSTNKIAAVVELLLRPAVFAPLLVGVAMGVSACFVDRGLPTNDEGVVLAWAGKILRGGVFYRDIDAYQFPGAAYLLAGWMRLVGEHVNAARWLAAVVFSCLLLGLYLIAVQLLERRRAAIFGLGLLSFKLLASPAFTAFMYADLSLCFASFAIALLVAHSYRGASISLVASGALVALATASKQNLGIYLAGTGVLLLAFSPTLLGTPDRGVRRRLFEVGAFAFGLFLTAAPMLGYFAAKGVFGQLVSSGLLQPFLQYLPTSGISFAEPLEWWNLGALQGGSGFPYFVAPYWSMLMNDQLPGESWYPVYWTAGEIFVRALYTSLPVAFLVVLWRWWRGVRAGRITPRDRKPFAFALLALAVVLSAFPRADFFHVVCVYPVVFLLLFTFGEPTAGEADDREHRRRAPWISACAVSLLLVATGSLAIAHHAQKTYRMQIARADLYIDPTRSWVETVVRYLDATLDHGEGFFVYGHEAYYYFLTGYYHAWPFAQLYPGQVGGDGGMPLVRVLQRRPPKIIVRGLMEWSGMPRIPRYAEALNFYVMVKYRADGEFFERHPPPAGEAPPDWAVDILRRRWRR